LNEVAEDGFPMELGQRIAVAAAAAAVVEVDIVLMEVEEFLVSPLSSASLIREREWRLMPLRENHPKPEGFCEVTPIFPPVGRRGSAFSAVIPA